MILVLLILYRSYISLVATNSKPAGTNEAIDLSASSSAKNVRSSRANQYPVMLDLTNFHSMDVPWDIDMPPSSTGWDSFDRITDNPISERPSSPEPDDFVILPYPEYSERPNASKISSSSSLEVIPDEAATQSSVKSHSNGVSDLACFPS